MIVRNLGLGGLGPMEIALILAVIAFLIWKHGGRPPKAS
jgi:hypothetical protein